MPVAEAEEARRAQVAERAFWMRREWSQADLVRDMCNKLSETVALIDANNAGPQ